MLGEVKYAFKCIGKWWIYIVAGLANVYISVDLLKTVAAHNVADEVVDTKMRICALIVTNLCLMMDADMYYY